MKNKTIIWSVILVTILIIAFFIFGNSTTEQNQNNENSIKGEWQNFVLRDIVTGESFKISDFAGKKVLIETFAVWCPTCTKQQRNIKELHEMIGDDVVSISLDTDPNEDEGKVRSHIESNGFDWRYAVSPSDMTMSLIDEFGTGIVSAPSAPMILICEDGSSRKLGGFGARSADKLIEEINEGC
jgi:cytochrome oxidase Cu insertion factor (SCO1/SenC/PrrC family)